MGDFVAKIKIFSIFNTGKINDLIIAKYSTCLGKEKAGKTPLPELIGSYRLSVFRF